MTTWLGLTWIDWLVLAVYLIGVTAIGVYSMRRVKNMTDFFMGGRRFGKIFMMFFAFGAGTHSEQAVSVVAGTWRVGLAGIWWQFLWLWATPFYWVIAPIMRRMRALTTSDFFEARFGTSTASLYAVFGIIISITIMGGGLYGSGKMVNALTGGQLDDLSEQLDWRIVPELKRAKVTPAAGDVGATSEQTAGAQSDKPVRQWQFRMRPVAGYEIAVLAITVLFVTYGLAGGLGAAIITDFIQGILTIIFSFLLLPWIFMKIGGKLTTSEHGLTQDMLQLFGREDVAQLLGKEPITVFYVVMLSATALTGIAVQPHIMGVCGAGKTEFEGRFGFTFGNFIKRFCTVAWTFIGLAAIVWYLGENSPLANPPADDPRREEKIEKYEQLKEFRVASERQRALVEQVKSGGDVTAAEQRELEELTARVEQLNVADKEFADNLFGAAAYDILPGVMPGLVGLLLAALLAAIMSTSDAQMVVASGLFTENIYKRFIRPEATQHHYLWVGRIAALVIVLLALLLQTTFTDVIHALKVIIQTPAAIGISLWFGISWRRWNTPAVWVSSLVTFAMWALLANYGALVDWQPALEVLPDYMLIDPESTSLTVKSAWVICLYLCAGALSGIIVSLLTPRPPKEKLDTFFRVMRTPVKEGEVVTAPCTLPEGSGDPVPKLIDHPDIEIPRPTKTDLIGFAGAWLMVFLIIAFVMWLAS